MAKFILQRGIEYNGKIIKMQDLEKHNIFKINVFPYHNVEPFTGDYAKVSKKWTFEELCNISESFIDHPHVEEIKKYGIILYGYINRDGVEVIPPIYEGISPLVNGYFLAAPAFEDDFNWVDCYGNFISPSNYPEIFYFSNDRAMFKHNNVDKYNFIKVEDGKRLDVTGYSGLMPFTEGLAAFKKYNNSLWGYINIDNEVDINPQFKLVKQMINGMAPVMNDDNKWGYIDYFGQLVIDYSYDNAFSFNNDIAIVLKDGEFLLINKENEIIKELDEEEITSYGDDLTYGSIVNKYAAPYGITNKYYYVDSEYDFQNYLTLPAPQIIKKNYRYVLVNPNDNKIITDIEWHDIKEFKNGYSPAVYNNRAVHLDCNGEPLIHGLNVFDIDTFANNYYGYLLIESNKTHLISAKKKYGLLIKSGKIVSEKWFDTEDEINEYIFENDEYIDRKDKQKVYIRS